MANMTNLMEQKLLELLFNNDNFANIGDATGLVGSTTPGSFYISLHTADPADAGTQTTSEATYTSYARVAVARNDTNWLVADAAGVWTAENISSISFPTATGGTNTITHFGIGQNASGAGDLFIHGELTTPRSVSSGITPSFAAGDLTIEAR
jgi:hypothetical protein